MFSLIEFIVAVIVATVVSYGIDKMIEKDLMEHRDDDVAL